MNFFKIRTLVGKEWEEVFKNRMVLITVLLLPLVFTALPLITIGTTSGIEADAAAVNEEVPDEFFGDACVGLDDGECVQVFMVNIFTLLFMMIPIIIPVTFAAYSIVGEKTSRSLEPLLATPITTMELIVSKAIAAIIPAVLATWLAFGVYLTAARFMVSSDAVWERITAPHWFVAIFVVGPLLSLAGISVAIIISSRVTDPRAAEQISGLVVIPFILLIVGQSVGFILIDQSTIFIMGAVVLIVDIVLIFFAIQLFERETILTRWK